MNMDACAKAAATWFGCGLSPKAPGTIGSLGALPVPFLFAWFFPGHYHLLLTAALIVVILFGLWATQRMIQMTGCKDPQSVVIDEVAGVWIASLALSPHWVIGFGLVAAFALFRLFDISKPLGIHRLESLPGAWGVMSDDLLAGCYSALLLLGFRAWIT